MARAKFATVENVQEAVQNANGQFEAIQDRMMKAFGTANEAAKANVEAFNAAGVAATKGFEAFTKAMTLFVKEAGEATKTTVDTLRGAKSAKEFFDLQQARSKAHYDHFVAETSKLTELYVKLAGDVVEPISTRYAVAMEQATKAAR